MDRITADLLLLASNLVFMVSTWRLFYDSLIGQQRIIQSWQFLLVTASAIALVACGQFTINLYLSGIASAINLSIYAAILLATDAYSNKLKALTIGLCVTTSLYIVGFIIK